MLQECSYLSGSWNSVRHMSSVWDLGCQWIVFVMSRAKMVKHDKIKRGGRRCTDTLRTQSDLSNMTNKLVKNTVTARFDEFRGTILLI